MNNNQELIDNVYKKFQTTMIGALARFENSFGHLWEKEDDQGNKYYDLWQDTRNSILNNGNKQARSAINDIEKALNPRFSKKYSYKFDFRKPGDNNYEN